MIDIERRLQHAARELREVRIDPPPLPVDAPAPRHRTGRLPTLVMPALFVLGGLAMVVGGTGRQTDDTVDDTAPVTATAAIAAPEVLSAPSAAAPTPLTARQEVALIASLAPARATPEPEPDPEPRVAPAAPTPRSFGRQYR